ncbi:hypothetical protein Dimus_017235 [Dionaea muscipula]
MDHLISVVVMLLAAACLIPQNVAALLTPNYYDHTCPDLESIVRSVVEQKINETFDTVPKTIHFYFQDCFLGGCDASILTRTPLTNEAVDTVIKAKAAVDSTPGCKNKVSCADIFTIAARDVIHLTGGPHYQVELGRFDSLPNATGINGTVPNLAMDLDQLTAMFAERGLSQTDMIALFGCHTVGHAHCGAFTNRLYNFSNSSPVDPTLNPRYATKLQALCPVDVDPSVEASLDPVTPQRFDNYYYKNLVNGMGLLSVDQLLYTDKRSMPYVVDWAWNPCHFNEALANAMIKMGRIGVKSSNDGNIRVRCEAYN